MYEYREFPRMMYGPHKATCIVHDRKAQDALGEEWRTEPHGAMNNLVEVAPVAPISAPEVSEEAQALQARATAVNLKTDRRWGIETLKLRVIEAEALASA